MRITLPATLALLILIVFPISTFTEGADAAARFGTNRVPAIEPAWTLNELILHDFVESAAGANPVTALTADASGALYGTAQLASVVFKLTPHTGGGVTTWSYSVIYAFAAGGPAGFGVGRALTIDAHGVLYGVTPGGGVECAIAEVYYGPGSGCGTVFSLTPPGAGKSQWTESVLYAFTGLNGDGGVPSGRLLRDARGALYGVTTIGGAGSGTGSGTVYKLTPPAAAGGAWAERVLHRFNGATDGSAPEAGLIADTYGALYGTAQGGQEPGQSRYGQGVVFQLSPPASGTTTWTESILHNFNGGPSDGALPTADPLVTDGTGNLYGTTVQGGGTGCGVADGCGTVFKLTRPARQPSGARWPASVVYTFKGGTDGAIPQSGLTVACGKGYGTTSSGGTSGLGNGTVFSLAPPAAGKTAWTEHVLYRFGLEVGGTNVSGASPEGPVLFGPRGHLYGTTLFGGPNGSGVVFDLSNGGVGCP